MYAHEPVRPSATRASTYPYSPKLTHETGLLGFRVFFVLWYEITVDGTLNVFCLPLGLNLTLDELIGAHGLESLAPGPP